MKVKELIKLLTNMNQELDVIVNMACYDEPGENVAIVQENKEHGYVLISG